MEYVFAHTFADPEAGRDGVDKIAARAVVESLRVVDILIGSPEDLQYLAFRAEFSDQLFLILRTHAVAHAIASVGIRPDGYSTIDLDAYVRNTEISDEILQATARVRFLVRCLPKTIEDHRQLYPVEEEAAWAALAKAEHLALDGTDDHLAQEAVVELEKWFLLAQKGIRLLRGDADAKAEFAQILERAEKYVAAHEHEHEHVVLISKGEAHGTAEQVREALRMLDQEERELQTMAEALQERRISLERQL